jgi:NtrC-family two-component system response regulator AlgB
LRGFSEEALVALRKYPWPGNIRELRNVIERAAILSTSALVGLEHLPDSVSPHISPVQVGDPIPLSVIEENHVRRVLSSTLSIHDAAKILGIDKATLWRKRKQYGI